MTTDEFIQIHRNDDCATLALRYSRVEGVDMPFALEQIAAWQTAKHKLPTWAETKGIVFPARLAMEQCSSELTAKYKRQLTERLMIDLFSSEEDEKTNRELSTFTDLTGGFGVDFAMIAPLFHSATYVEQRSELCHAVRNNLPLLGVNNAVVICEDSIEFLKRMPTTTLLYIDPARRDTNGQRTYALSDCTPDVLALMPQIMAKTQRLLLKLSPMLDITQTVLDVEATGVAQVIEVYVVAVGNECKELLLVVKKNDDDSDNKKQKLFCINDDTAFVVEKLRSLKSLKTLESLRTSTPLETDKLVGKHLYEPNAAIMKAGCFAEVAQRYGLKQLDNNSHLFLSQQKNDNFPGRKFIINAVTTMKKECIKGVFATMKSANVAVRNFPLTAEQLRKRLRLKDGGETFVFGTTVKRDHLLLICSKY